MPRRLHNLWLHYLRLAGIRSTSHGLALFWEIFFIRRAWLRLFDHVPHWYPHVDFNKLRLSDVFRILLQSIWLILVIPPEQRPPHQPWHVRKDRVIQQLTHLRLALTPRWLEKRIAQETHRLHQLFEKLEKSMDQPRHLDINNAWLKYFAYFVALIFISLCATTPLNQVEQAVFLVLLWVISLWLSKIPGTMITLMLIIISSMAASRYIWWRLNETLNWDDSAGFLWGLLLAFAEMYAWMILLLGYIQTSWPLKRQPAVLTPNSQEWPSVDVYIPTYNEPLSVVAPTVLAAQGLDWPKDKLHVYLLDDGRREEMRKFAQEVNVGYLTRDNNAHAKAGNLNCAMKKTQGELIAIFDCDHMPTRSFLQMTVGWFMRDDKLALLQTPHHFFSPDPFERNLGLFRKVPNEGELFYGAIQDSNDLWNATFFCGSCAVIRRAPLEEIHGIAVETVTEDAHTALKMQRLGYNTAYLRLPQAAGLATESLSSHVAQRIRWARGMAQIFRLDNPFLGKGLTWVQRICYGNAMLHFFNGLPRLIFLTAPLAFLLFDIYIIYAHALTIALYALPNILHATLTNSRLQGKYRHSFWGEIYETVLAWYIARPTLVALFFPAEGKFNVTSKGGLVMERYYDWIISAPYIAILLLNLLAFSVGAWRLLFGEPDEFTTVLLNMAWTAYNLLLLGGAIAVATEGKQIRNTHRVALKLPAILHLPNGHLMRCHTTDFSEGGIALHLDQPTSLKTGELIQISLWRGEQECVFTAKVIVNAQEHLRLQWVFHHHQQETLMVQCTFGRADAWVSWSEERPYDKPLASLHEVFYYGILGYRRLREACWHTLLPKIKQTRYWQSVASVLPHQVVEQAQKK